MKNPELSLIEPDLKFLHETALRLLTWKENPDGWINDEDYSSTNLSTELDENKHRIAWFNAIFTLVNAITDDWNFIEETRVKLKNQCLPLRNLFNIPPKETTSEMIELGDQILHFILDVTEELSPDLITTSQEQKASTEDLSSTQ